MERAQRRKQEEEAHYVPLARAEAPEEAVRPPRAPRHRLQRLLHGLASAAAARHGWMDGRLLAVRALASFRSVIYLSYRERE